MPASFAYPTDLARRVLERLADLHYRRPALGALTKLLEVAFFASMRTEEGEPVRCSITYIDPERPDPRPPRRIVANRWRCMPFAQPIELTPSNLVKIAESLDADASSIAAYADARQMPFIWGALDQRSGRARFIARESDRGPESPGLLECVIVGFGALEIYKDYTLLASLRQGTIGVGYNDVLGDDGPVLRALRPAIDDLAQSVRDVVGAKVFEERNHWTDSVTDYWTRSLSRILLGVQRYGHGGAIILTPDNSNDGLLIKYPVSYARLGEALVRLSVRTIDRVAAEDEISENFLDKHKQEIPAQLYLEEIVGRNDGEDTESEITGCVRFIASLSRVDGAVVMNRSLALRGYGAVIEVEESPASVWLAADVRGRVRDLTRLTPQNFGTRHQSMMRFCYSRTGSIGFVVSQDGDVRAMTRVGHRLIVWEDVRLRRG